MRLLIYEWCTSGGLAGPAAPAVAAGTATLDPMAGEGRCMVRAVATDAVRDGAIDVTVLVDDQRPLDLPPGTHVARVPAGEELDRLRAEAARADAVIVIAPESHGLLTVRTATCRAAGGRVLASDAALVELASDKQATILALAAGGLPVPPGTVRVAGGAWPVGFLRPAVRKARDGVGCEGFAVLPPGDPPPEPASRAERIEAFVPGVPIGVACLCGPSTVLALPPLVQQFGRDAGGGLAYVGGGPLTDPRSQDRARGLATRAIRALERAAGPATARGWLGVDMILGSRADGRDDRVLEVNPRLTSSFVGHAAAATTSLVRLMLEIAAGHPPPRIAYAPRNFCVMES